MSNTCQQCGDQLYGRADKKFCDDQCRSAYHNGLNSEANNTMRMVHRRLRSNWRLLRKYCKKSSVERKLEELTGGGFNLNVITGIEHQNNQVIYRCYEFQYQVMESGMVRITKDLEVAKEGLSSSSDRE